MLSGHNRQNAARIAGLAEIPAIVKEGLSDEEAYVYVIETNVIQRSFTDLAPSEKAAVLSAGYPEKGTVIIFHKHKASHPYHQHGRANTLRRAVRSIRGHDRWQMNGRK